MNRKDFELVARIVKAGPSDRHSVAALTEARRFADTFDKAEGCHGFDRAKFLKACGVPE